MGKYMRKAKLTGDVAVMDVSQSSLGVRTRARTLALQKLGASSTQPPVPEQNPSSESSYLQLRSRRLQKSPLQQPTCCRQQNPSPRGAGSRLPMSSGVSVFDGSGGSMNEKDRILGETQIGEEEKKSSCDAAETKAPCEVGVEEACFGENNLDFEGRERPYSRESTPCHLIRESSAISTPCSSTRPTSLEASNRRTQNYIERSMPSAQEFEEFFARHEQEQLRRFAEKYNFDIVNEKPLEGHYEWVKIQP